MPGIRNRLLNIGIMYAPVNNVVIRAMHSYRLNSMTMQNRMNPSTVTTSTTEGFGDLFIGAGYTFLDWHKHPVQHSLHADLLIGLPTGSIDEKNDSTGKNQAYMLQLGSGSYELRPSVAYNGSTKHVTWGAQVISVIRLNENANEYKLGNEYEANIWSSFRFIDWLSFSLRLNATLQDNITGADPNQASTTMMPGADPESSGYKQIMALAGLNFYLPHMGNVMSRIGVEGGVPIYQFRNGTQRALSYTWTAGLRVMASF